MFCFYFGLDAFPLCNDVILAYSQFLSRSFKSVSSIVNYISGIKTLARLLEFEVPNQSIEQRLLIRGLARLKGHLPRQALPITPQILLRISRLLDCNKVFDATFWSCITLMFFLMARKSNMVPDSVKSFDPKKQLIRGDILIGDYVAIVYLRWSKTNQFGARQLAVPLIKMQSALCPVTAFAQMCRLLPLPQEAPAFCHFVNKKLVPMTYTRLQSRLKELIQVIDLNPLNYSSHSLRRGGATWAFECGASADLVQMQGDWVSDSYKRYLHVSLPKRSQTSRLMASQIDF